MNKCIAILLLSGHCLFAQDGTDKTSVPLRDPSRPARISTQVMVGSITVRGADIKDIEVEGRGRGRMRRDEVPSERADGLKRLDIPGGSGIEVVENNNVVNVKANSWGLPGDLVMTVPRKSNLQLKSMSGEITVEGVDGEIDVNSMSGKIVLKNVSGSVVAHALNGAVFATIDRVDSSKPMSFSTMNGVIDVTLPDSLKADLAVKVDNGDVYTDFDVKPSAHSSTWQTDDSGSRDGTHRIRLEHSFHGTINGGGPDLQFRSFNGQIYIRRRK